MNSHDVKQLEVGGLEREPEWQALDSLEENG